MPRRLFRWWGFRRCTRVDELEAAVRASDLLSHGFDQIQRGRRRPARRAVGRRPGTTDDPVGLLVWHLMRVQDDHVAGVVCGEQVRVSQGWSERFGLSLGATDVGYGHSTDQVAAVRLDASFLGGYAEAVHARTARAVAALSDGHLDRVLDASCALPVTAGVRRSVCSAMVYSTWGRADTCAVCYDAVTEVGAFSP